MVGERSATSEFIAESVTTNPVVIRRILGVLGKAGFVETHPGVGGGSTLIRDPEEITLLEVYRLMENSELFSLHHQSPSDDCVCGRNIQTVLSGVFDDARTAMEKVLSEITIGRIVREIEELEEEGQCKPC